MADYFSGNFQIFVFFLALDQLRLEKERCDIYLTIWYDTADLYIHATLGWEVVLSLGQTILGYMVEYQVLHIQEVPTFFVKGTRE